MTEKIFSFIIFLLFLVLNIGFLSAQTAYYTYKNENGKTNCISLEIKGSRKSLVYNMTTGFNILNINLPDGSLANNLTIYLSPTREDFPLNLTVINNDNTIFYFPYYLGYQDKFFNGSKRFSFYSHGNFSVSLPINSHIKNAILDLSFQSPVEFNSTSIYLNFTGYLSIPPQNIWMLKEKYQTDYIDKFEKAIQSIHADNKSNLYCVLTNNTLHIYRGLYLLEDIYNISSVSYVVYGDINNDNADEVIFSKNKKLYVLYPQNSFMIDFLNISGLVCVYNKSIYLFDEINNTLYKIVVSNGSYVVNPIGNISINGSLYHPKMFINKNLVYLVSENNVYLYNMTSSNTIKYTFDFYIDGISFCYYNFSDYVILGCSDRSIRIYTQDLSKLVYKYTVDYPSYYYLKNVRVSDWNLDGLDDIIFTQKMGIMVMENNGNISTWKNPKRLFINPISYEYIDAVWVGDIYNDGDPDILVGYPDGSIYFIRNNVQISTIRIKMAINILNDIAQKISEESSDPYINIPFHIYTNKAASITLCNLSITYNKTFKINLPEVLDNVNLTFLTDAQSKLYLDIFVDYEYCPPMLMKNIPDIVIMEDGSLSLDMSEYFWDDKNSMSYSLDCESDYISYVSNGTTLTILPSPNFYGNVTAYVKVRDSDGFYVYSNPFNITVLPVDDPPVVLPLSDIKIRTNKTYYLDLSAKVWDIDSPSLNITTSDPTNITPLSNLTLKIRYSIPGNYTAMVYVSDGNLTNQTSLNITVVPYSAPLWVKEIPDVVTYKNEPLDEQNSPINLRDFVEDPDTPVDSLAFEIVSQSHPHIDVSISPSGKVLVNPEENYVGTSTVVVRVSDSQYSDITSFRVVVKYKNYPPVYLGGLNSKYYVKEDTVWKVNLAEHFDDLETPSDKLVYRASSPEIIINGSYAYWMPKHGDKSIYNLTFYAYDNASDYAVSDPITLVYVEVNDPPVYIGGLTDITIKESEELILNLSNYFTDEETPNSLIFGCNVSDIVINGTIAEYSGSKSLKNVVFYAIDPQNESLIAYSNPINITVIPQNKPPKAYIDDVRIIEGGVILKGHGMDVDGSVVKYEWYSSKDGFLGSGSYLQVRLSPGKHIISFRVMDNNGTWSNFTYREIFIPETNYGQIILYGGISLITCGGIMISATYLSIWGWKKRTAISD